MDVGTESDDAYVLRLKSHAKLQGVLPHGAPWWCWPLLVAAVRACSP